MPRYACQVCGAPALPGTNRCGHHPKVESKDHRRPYRGLAITRRTLAEVIERDGGICHICGNPGADTMDHTPTSYRELMDLFGGEHPPVHVALNTDNLKAAHRGCNQSRGTGQPRTQRRT